MYTLLLPIYIKGEHIQLVRQSILVRAIMRLLLLLLLPLVCCLGHPLLQELKALPKAPPPKRLTSTEKCAEAQLDEFYSSLFGLCFAQAEQPVDEAFAAGQPLIEVKKAICKAITSKVKCVEDNAQQCFNATSADNIRSNIIFDELQKSLGSNSTSSSQLGPSFVASCPVLKDNEAGVMLKKTGSNACSFIELDNAKKDVRKCFADATLTRDNRLDLLPFVSDQRAVYVKAMCDYRASFVNCRSSDFYACLGEQEREEDFQLQDEAFAVLEANIAEKSIDGFTFKQTCSGSTDTVRTKT